MGGNAVDGEWRDVDAVEDGVKAGTCLERFRCLDVGPGCNRLQRESTILFSAQRETGSAHFGVNVLFHTNEDINLMRGIHVPPPKRPQPPRLLPDRPHRFPPSSTFLREPVFDGAVIEYSKGNDLKDSLLV